MVLLRTSYPETSDLIFLEVINLRPEWADGEGDLGSQARTGEGGLLCSLALGSGAEEPPRASSRSTFLQNPCAQIQGIIPSMES